MRDAKIAGVVVNFKETECTLDTNMTLMELYEAVRDGALGNWTSLVITMVPKVEGEDDSVSAQ